MALLSTEAAPATPAPQPRSRRWLYVLLIAVVVVVIAAYGSGATRYLSLDELGRRHAELKAFVHAHPVQSLLIYVGVYLASVVLFLPAMTLLLLAGGFLFGVPLATSTALCTAVAGAVATFLLARSTLGAALRGRIKAGGLVAAMEAGVSRHAFTYMLTLRMVPIFPFGVVNVVAGLVKMPLSVFSAATFLGLLPPALVYTSLGVGLAQVFERGEHVDMHTFAKPGIVGPLLGLAVLSLIPHLIRAWRAKFSPVKT
ncbi:MAG: TVP38/TMEM64 family protein [Caulobacteraceae bacterium]